jgi:hypothetical protein
VFRFSQALSYEIHLKKKRDAMKKLAALALSLLLTAGTAFADSPKDSPKESDTPPAKSTTAAKPATAKSNAEIAAEMEELRQALQSQQEQLQLLKEELAKRDAEIEAAREAAAAANSRASEASAKATAAEATSNEVKSTTTALNSSVATLAASNAAAVNATPANATAQGSAPAEEKGPLAIRYKGVTLTPGGFLAGETVYRNNATSAGLATPFTGIPYPGNSLEKVSEWQMEGRQSRLSVRVDAGVGSTKLTGYVEADFLGAGTTSNNRQTNSYVFRQRQLWARTEFASGWIFTAGQQWTLATENRKGINNLTEATPMMIDPNYVVGFTWQRADAVRLVKTVNDKLALGVSAEGSQATVGGRGFSTYTSTTATGAVTTFQNFWVDAPGSGAGLLNAFDATGYTVNKLPDFIVKAAFDPGFGHYEVFGIVSEFRNRVYPCAVVGTTAKNFPTPAKPTVLPCYGNGTTAPSVTTAYNNSSTGGGVGFSAAAPLFSKHLDLGIKGVYGDAIGRYGAAQLSDVTARPDGTLAGIHDAQYLAKVEVHPSPKLDLYFYLGGEYAARTAYGGYQSVKVTATPAIPGCGGVGEQPCPGGGIQPSYPALSTTTIATNGIGGYGNKAANNTGCSTETLPSGTSTPGTGGTCAGDIRYIQEATVGFWNKLYQGEKGRVQWGLQYSYLFKVGWSGSGGVEGVGLPGNAPKATDNLFFTSFRYYLP